MSELELLMLPEMVHIWQQTLGWQPTTQQQQLFQQLYEGILEGNQQLNLTRITEPVEFWEKHLWDSLRGVWSQESEGKCEISPTSKIIDIGTGAGFPGFPVAIAFPDTAITLLDSTRKKITFLETLIAKLDLKNATTLTGRAEAIAKQPQHRQAYDIALLRAVAPASVCAEYSLPLLKKGGLAILYRGHWTDEETETLKPVLEPLGGEIQSIEAFTTPISHSIRHCLYIRKASVKEVKTPQLRKTGSET
ncbi:MAG: 16S rRNA (guanine(527)-N(7))-methyltransferase RsmG [Symplocastrum torsivum CPER-KK1]|jgi:16S rRNA (guanine527-N7)-methyltransferase|uniref:Ribosomal RNA small subunit methyltransferase G n=1 Tax=Symplocastrum torsivum CPER-KK1 TaxID=450513 RepID=A0A951PNB9_9CYAN|nr:16S rRNA (guanine(527)-N(7))-methyltransferase RsmG [Symplocastrum torsivum CPER-KK1]